MKERPILFSAPMVRAILEGRKNQTRRAIKLPNERGEWEASTIGGDGTYHSDGTPAPEMACIWNIKTGTTLVCPHGKHGDRLWVRETWQGPLFEGDLPEDHMSDKYEKPEFCHYKASGDNCDFIDADDNLVSRWRPSIHMPRWASRILLEITNVRVERLQEISDEDSLDEGIYPTSTGLYRGSAISQYKKLWESINGQGSWDLNPWAWVIEFKVLLTEARDKE